MTDEVAARILEAIAADRLLVLCGAGLSMAAPSDLPSAAAVARICADKYLARTGMSLDADLSGDLARMSLHFHERGRFQNFFIAELVPWDRFNGVPNEGHEAIADFLACGVLVGVSTTNFDSLVESAAGQIGERDFRAVVDAGDLAQQTPHRPYIKLHGCGIRSRPSTVWCQPQLSEAAVASRMAEFQAWLAANLGGRDLVFVGFWTDWSYLTDLLAAYLGATTPQHVYLVDPAGEADLRRKAPALWDWAHGRNITFHHCPESGVTFLDDLRRRWSAVYINRLMDESRATYAALFGSDPGVMRGSPAGDSRTLYALRRDLTGTSRTAAVRGRQPEDVNHLAGALHRRLVERGSTYSAHRHEFGGRSIRLVSGRGRLLSQVKAAFDAEPPLPLPADVVVCAGAIEDAAPPHIVRSAGAATIVRGGGFHDWKTHEALTADLQ